MDFRIPWWVKMILYQIIYIFPAATAAKSLQLCPTLCDPIDRSPPGSPVPGILQQEHWSGLPLPSPLVAATSMLIKESLLLFLGLLISPSCEEQLQLFSENQENGNC